MNIKEVIELAAEKGRVVVPSAVDDEYCALDCGPAPDSNERMRLTADGALLTVVDGRYWQAGQIKDVYNWLKTLKDGA